MNSLSLIIFFVVSCKMMIFVFGQQQTFGQKLQPYMDIVAKRNILKYNNKCSQKIEKVRNAQQKLIWGTLNSLGSIRPLDIEKLEAELIQMFSVIIEVKGLYCNDLKNLMCNSEDVCDCVTYESITNKGFRLEFHWEGNKCVAPGGSICLPVEGIEVSLTAGILPAEIPCSVKTSCILKSSRLPCTNSSFYAEFHRLFEEYGEPSDRAKFLRKKITDGGLCVCDDQSTATRISTYSTFHIIIASILFNSLKSIF